ncbi:MICOS complex subunit MIC25-like [Ostrinia furnacalis]|uniref:MICOS complex subunit MIC25-like n=1 Tax=Ostrinia furnacalis TaxID=93504 RepID=UPI00103A5122|nr:MICOS complex subunit MIC25-like [Ostrinia furnacalis]
MGIISSKDTRRVSFDNTFALAPALNIQNSIQDENVVALDDLAADPDDDLIFKDIKSIEPTEEGDGDYWAHRIEFLKKEHQSINKIIEAEYEKTVENTNKTFEPPKVTNDKLQKIKPCLDWRAKILQCYEENPHQPLMCSSLVQAFSQCVSTCRIEK